MTKKDLVEIIEDCVYNSQVLIGERVCFDELRKELNEEVPEQLILTDVSKCDCDNHIACIVCGEEKGLDGDFWKRMKEQ